MTRKEVKNDFDKYTAGKYIYFDCMMFGEDRVDIKAVSRETNKPMMLKYPLVAEGMAVDWANPIEVRQYDPRKDW